MKKPLELAVELAEYGLYGAGADYDWCQKEWGADCVEAAIFLMRPYAKKIQVGKQNLDIDALETLARGLREEGKALKAEEEAEIAKRKKGN